MNRSRVVRLNSCIFWTLMFVDSALYGAGVVLLGQPGGGGLDVAAQPDGEPAQPRGRRRPSTRSACALSPDRSLIMRAEAGHLPHGGVDPEASGPDRLDARLVGGIEMAGQAGDPG